ncbi:MAG: NHL repeat-containing protein [Solirubrobacteraceae bacterium]
MRERSREAGHSVVGFARRSGAARLLAAVAVAVGGWLVLVPASALAVLHYPYLGQLTGLSLSFGVAVDEKTHETIVSDLAGGVVDVFSSKGELTASWNGSAETNPPGVPGGSFGSPWGVAVNDATGDIYVVDRRDSVVDILGPAGEYIGQLTGVGLTAPTGVAVDQATGDVYVANLEGNAVDVFESNGKYQSQLTGHAIESPFSVAVDDATGKVLVGENSGEGTVSVFDVATGLYEKTWRGSAGTNPPGTPQGGFDLATIMSVAVDDASGRVYVGTQEAHVVDAFDGAGHYLGQMTGTPSGSFSNPFGVAFDQASGDVYVDDGQAVDIFGEGVPLPSVTTEGVAGVSETGATLKGSVNPEGVPLGACEFEYGTSIGYDHRALCAPAGIGPGSAPVAVSAEVSGLEPNARYHYRLVATNANGTAEGSDETFVATSGGFGFQTTGPHAFSVVVSNSVVPSGEPTAGALGPLPEVANPHDLDTQAGSHPFAMTLNFRLKTNPLDELTSEQYAKDIAVEFPAGFAGSIVAVPQCPMYRLATSLVGCPTSSQVGTVTVYTNLGALPAPVYNMVPSDGGTAELSFPVEIVAQPVIVSVRTDGDYGIVSMTEGISQYIQFKGLAITLWGVPADPRHDAERYTPSSGSTYFGNRVPGNVNVVIKKETEQEQGKEIFFNGKGEEVSPEVPGEPMPNGSPLSAYLTNPTKCSSAGLEARVVGDSWTDPGPFNPVNHRPELSDPRWVQDSTPMYPGGLTGCNRLRFNPSIAVTPDTTKANSPSGYAINLHVPQSTEPFDLASPALENAVATLPQGLAINPGAADGLQACTSDSADPAGSPGNEIGLGTNVEPACPAASQVGSVELKTPLLPEILYGQVYLSAEQSGNHYGVFIVIRGEGLLVKLHSTVVANAATGQLTATFDDNPELPFSDFTLHFYGGPRAVFVNPAACGPATTTMDLTSWASGAGGLGDQTPSSTFNVSFDGNGASCPSPQPFAPSFTAGTTSIQAGGFSPLVSTFSRRDEDQLVNHVQLTAPVGLLGTLRGVPLCREPQAAEGACPAASQIGHTVVGVGSGAAPLYLPQPGEPENPVYVTGPYRGAPFGLTFVVHAIAGPYNLGNVVVRAAINVDPSTSALTVTSDPLPTIIDGIPVQVKSVNVVIDREHFVFNPTDCNPSQVQGSMTSRQGSTANLSSPFQVTGCGDLRFKPEFRVSTSGHPTRANGTSLDARLSFAANALGTQANVAKVKVELPKQLPSRLSTLQKACPAQTFESNPAACNPASVIGVAKAVTPTLPGVLSGPVYFVSHGGQEFPNLIIVLQGEGVRVNLVASTFISKAGVTSSTFNSIPDVPVNSFELYLPAGPYSALTALASPCKTRLVMPTTFTAQNGIVLHQNTPIAVTGCGAKAAKARKASRASRASRAGRARAAGRRHRRRAGHGGHNSGGTGRGPRRDAKNGRAGR